MLNYIKSELYRARHSAEIRGTAIGLLGLILFMNLVLCLMSDLPDFYGITSFSYSMLVSMPMLYCYVASDVAVMLYESDKRNGTLGNSIAYGLSRIEIFAGKCIVCFLTALVLLLLAFPAYILSAMLLLEEAGPTTVWDMLAEIPAMSLIAIASLILAILLLELFDNSFFSLLAWLAIIVLLPKILFLAGKGLASKTALLLGIAMWMPQNFFDSEMQVNMSKCITIWSTPEGMMKCLVSGAAGILVFVAAGVLLLRKKEL